MAQPYTIGAFDIVFDTQQRVLLCHRRDMDLWNLPGGGIESGELPTEAAVRETLEETGIQIDNLILVGVYGKPDQDDLVFAFIADVVGGQLTTTDEAGELAYFAVDEIPPNTSPRQVERIRDALRPKGFPYIRRQIAPSSRVWLKMLNGQKRK